VSKGELYDQQRVQIYYPNGYATARAGTQEQSQQIQTQRADPNQECHVMDDNIDPNTARRSFGAYMEHVYDIPHRMAAKQMV